jgi:cyclase
MAAAGAAAMSRLPELQAAPSKLELTPLSAQLLLISGGGGNVVAFAAEEGLLLVDGGSVEHSAAVLKAARQFGKSKNVHTLFNTHWHRDQTGSNVALGNAGTRIIAHENTKLWLGTEVESKWEKRVYPRLPANALPNKTIYTTDSLSFGGEQIDFGYLPQAHTDGDIYVYFRKADVLVAGDVAAYGAFPIIDYSTNGWIGGLSDATQQLLDLSNEKTRIVPGRGSVLTRANVQAEREMLVAMRQRLAKLLTDGMSVQDMIDAMPAKDFTAAWGDPSLFIANAWPGMVHRARELGVAIV